MDDHLMENNTWTLEQLITLTQYPRAIVFSCHDHLMNTQGKVQDFDIFVKEVQRRFNLALEERDSQPQFNVQPTKENRSRGKLRYNPKPYVTTHQAFDDDQRQQEIDKLIEAQALAPDKEPPLNSPEYFAHMLVFNKK